MIKTDGWKKADRMTALSAIIALNVVILSWIVTVQRGVRLHEEQKNQYTPFHLAILS